MQTNPYVNIQHEDVERETFKTMCEGILDRTDVSYRGKDIVEDIYERLCDGVRNSDGKPLSEKQKALLINIESGLWYAGESLPKEHCDGYIYFALDAHAGVLKIGYSKDPEKRVAALRTARPSLTIVHTDRGNKEIERMAHLKLSHRKVGGEWFDVSDLVRTVSPTLGEKCVEWFSDAVSMFDAMIAEREYKDFDYWRSSVKEDGVGAKNEA